MELKTIFSNVEPSNRNVVWISTINGIVVQRVYTAKGWQVVGSPSVSEGGSTSLDEPTDKYIFKREYKANGGLKTKEEFNDELFNLIG